MILDNYVEYLWYKPEKHRSYYFRYKMEHRKASLAGLPPEMLKEITKVDRA